MTFIWLRLAILLLFLAPTFFCLHCSSPSATRSTPHRGSPFCLPSREPGEAPACSACGTGAGAGREALPHPMSIRAAGGLLCLWKNQAEKGEWGIQYHLLTPLGSKSVLHKFWYAAQKYLIYYIKKKKEMQSCLTLLKTAGRTQ